MKVKVYNMESPNGNKVANQFEIYTSKGKYFHSYNSIIGFIDNNVQWSPSHKDYKQYNKLWKKYNAFK